jgi:hypothetical protein
MTICDYNKQNASSNCYNLKTKQQKVERVSQEKKKPTICLWLYFFYRTAVPSAEKLTGIGNRLTIYKPEQNKYSIMQAKQPSKPVQ